jgi:predicted permease
MGNAWSDIEFAVRTLRKAPVFSAVAVLSLALGIGANTAIFTLLDQVMLRLLPVRDPQQLALLSMKGMHYGSNWGGNALSYPMYQDIKSNNQVFSDMFCRFPYRVSLAFAGQTERVAGELVSGTYFPVLGVGAEVGRTFTPEEDRTPGGHPVVMLSYAYWKSRFAGNPDIIGKTVTVNGHNMTVVGVAQRSFDGVELGYRTQVFVPVMMKAQMTPLWDALKDRRWRWVNSFGRLKPGVTMKQAEASLQPFFHGILEMEVKEPAFRNASAYDREQFLKNVMQVLPGSQGRSYLRRQLETPLWVLMSITAGVLLIACGNVAGLLIARASSRQKEIAVRLALGAGRWRLIQQLLLESLLLSALGGVLGLFLALGTDKVLLTFLPPETTDLKISTVPDWRLLLFLFSITFLTAILFGLIPALQSSKTDVAPVLKDQAGAVVGGSHVRIRKILVAAQVSLSLLLLIGAGLFIRSLQNLRNLGPGFKAENIVAFNVDPSLNGYDVAKSKAFFTRLMETMASIPGVESVGMASMRILEDNEWDSSVTVEGYRAKDGENVAAYMNSISPGYFQALGVPILAGRDFTVKDTEEIFHGPDKDDFSPTKVIINEKFAKKYYGTTNALGRHVGFGNDPGTKTDMEVIGVVKDIKYTNLRDPIPIQMFVPFLASRYVGDMTVYIGSTVDPNQIAAAARIRTRQLDPNVPVYALRTMENQVSNSLLIERSIASLSTMFGVVATLLASIGLYGVMAYTVSRRTREIGIRMALGAFTGDVIWMVMREVLALVALGVAAGFAAAMGLTQYVKSQLFGLTTMDPMSLAASVLILAAIACLAGYIPAFRASKVDAMQALRYE